MMIKLNFNTPVVNKDGDIQNLSDLGGGIVPATQDTLGGVKIGEGLNITPDGLLSVLGGGSIDFVNDSIVDTPWTVGGKKIKAWYHTENKTTTYKSVPLPSGVDRSRVLFVFGTAHTADNKTHLLSDNDLVQKAYGTDYSNTPGFTLTLSQLNLYGTNSGTWHIFTFFKEA